jgi:hypothetical protein
MGGNMALVEMALKEAVRLKLFFELGFELHFVLRRDDFSESP